MKCIPIVFLILLFGVGEIRALNISSIKGKGNKKDFEFSKTILIRGIEFKNGFLKMPLDGYKKKKYSNIKILSKDFYHKISNCFKGETCERNGKRKDVLFKIEKIFPLKSPLRVANANVSFDDELIVVFGIVKNKEARGKKSEAGNGKKRKKEKEEMWISYPKDFEIRDEAFKNKLEESIKGEFEKTFKK